MDQLSPLAPDLRDGNPCEHLSGAETSAAISFDLNRDGWICWPEREDLSLEFMRLLAAAQDAAKQFVDELTPGISAHFWKKLLTMTWS